MWHANCTQRNRDDSRLLVVGNQIVNLIPDLFLAITCVLSVQMGHANPFQTFMYQEFSNDIWISSIQWVLTPVITLKIRESIETPTPKVGAHLGMWGLIPSHFPTPSGT
jgi:hypothetical protein